MRPRTLQVLADVERESGGLIRISLDVVDGKGPPYLSVSEWREVRGELVCRHRMPIALADAPRVLLALWRAVENVTGGFSFGRGVE